MTEPQPTTRRGLLDAVKATAEHGITITAILLITLSTDLTFIAAIVLGGDGAQAPPSEALKIAAVSGLLGFLGGDVRRQLKTQREQQAAADG